MSILWMELKSFLLEMILKKHVVGLKSRLICLGKAKKRTRLMILHLYWYLYNSSKLFKNIFRKETIIF